MNNRMSEKLRNSRGVSMIIALIFMMLCLFIGGTVLTAATVNSGRIKHAPKRQVFIDHRSSAMLMADELRTPEDQNLQLKITKVTVKNESILVKPNGFQVPNGSAVVSEQVHFVASHDMDKVTALQRLVIETAVRTYQRDHGLSNVSIEYLKTDGTKGVIPQESFYVEKPSDASSFASGKLHVNGTWRKGGAGSDMDLTAFDAYCYGKSNYDFVVDFDEYSQVKVGLEVRMDASSSTLLAPPIVEVFCDESVAGADKPGNRYTTTKELTTVSWPGPMIAKGGAA